MSRWEQHRDAAVVDLAAAGMTDKVDEILGHLHDAAANVNRAIDEAESDAESEEDR